MVSRTSHVVAFALLLQLLSAVPSAAQVHGVPVVPTPKKVDATNVRGIKNVRGIINVRGSLVPSTSFDDAGAKKINAEDAAFDTNYTPEDGLGLSASLVARVWKNLGVRVGGTHYSTESVGVFQASVPHPFFFNRSRTVNGDKAGLSKSESTLELHLAGIFPIGRRVTASMSAGPTVIRLQNQLISDFTFSEFYPYDTATLSSMTATEFSGSKVTLGMTGEVGIFLTRHLGLAAGVQFASAEVPVQAAADQRLVKSGGARFSLGLSTRF